jgi:hypothetical protein
MTNLKISYRVAFNVNWEKSYKVVSNKNRFFYNESFKNLPLIFHYSKNIHREQDYAVYAVIPNDNDIDLAREYFFSDADWFCRSKHCMRNDTGIFWGVSKKQMLLSICDFGYIFGDIL